MSVRISNNTLEVFDPATGEDLTQFSMTSVQELDSILQTAKAGAEKYNYSSFFRRQKLMTQLQKGITRRMDDFIKTICSETGKKADEGLMEVFISLEHIKQSSHHLYEALGKRNRRSGILKTRKAWVEYEAMGVAGIISPWNYPLILTVSPMVEALLSGNSVVLKPSEHTPLTTKLLKKVWDESTESPELFQPVYGAGEIGNALVASPLTDVICFTGSTAIGRKIAETCAPLFKPVILELGGKDPMIILEDADIDRSVEAAIWGGLSNAGQTCISVERIFVQEKIYPEIVEKLKDKVQTLSSGKGDTPVGAISVDVSLDKIRDQINDAKNNSDVFEGNADEGRFIPPCLVVNPPFEAKILQEETFGPVMTIHPFQTDNDAIELANKTGYGLSASIFGKSKKRIGYISRRVHAGAVAINDVLTHYGIADLPFGGKGISGMGKVHGKEGLRAFSHQKSYMTNRISFKVEFWWYKRSKKFAQLLRKWIKWQYS
jgi:acyl-CoA reductase-like NAD-dependent aldehyde dehydrogenase